MQYCSDLESQLGLIGFYSNLLTYQPRIEAT